MANNTKICVGDHFLMEFGSRMFTNQNWTFGHDVKIATNCSIFSREPGKNGILTIGNGTHIGDNSILDITDNLAIGNEVAIGPNTTIYTHDHDYSNPNQPSWKGGLIKDKVQIYDGAWIGCNVTILPSVKIGKFAVVAAGSVVTKDIPENEMWGGIPAKKIKNLF